jgi:mono/diheme cytochrome c family protein
VTVSLLAVWAMVLSVAERVWLGGGGPHKGKGKMQRLALFSLVILFVSSAMVAQQAGDPGAGAAYAKQYCSKCHAIGDTENSPEPKAPRFKDVANTPGMIAPVLDVWLRRPHLYMPNIVVEADQIDNVIAYILSLKKPQ